ncbi:hypothetical protein MSAN_01069900 [Mycena sanguinolenta]|uniref:Transposase n=1 Tax=Mycena sanguinolenta TaxID=230812 RepID=A0A8H6YS11_9AGAR|nr:hypothetical protein MSAN_01069900 [Mycena sanguinolenta]
MPPPRWNPPPEMAPHLEYSGEQVRCLICANIRKTGVGGWISRKNLKAHLGTPTHLGAYDSEMQRALTEAKEHEQLSGAYNSAEAQELPEVDMSEVSQIPPMFPPESELDIQMEIVSPHTNFSQLMSEFGETPEAEELGPEATRLLLQQEFERMLENAYHDPALGPGVEEQYIADELPKTSDNDDEDTHCFDPDLVEDSEYFPYPNKTVMLLDIMDNLPRCRFTGDQISLILHFATKLGVANVPSLKGFRKIQQSLQSNYGKKPEKSISHLGNVFYMNDIRDTLAADMANPLVAPHLHFYPEETQGPVSETFQAERWMEYTPSQLTPMYSRGVKRWWIEEVGQLRDGRYVLPHTWIVRNGVLTTDVSIVTRTEDGRWKLEDGIEETVDAVDLDLDFSDIQDQFGDELTWVDGHAVPAMPNPMRKLVDDDEDLFVLMVSPWADDVSGNRSKQYNKHMNMCTGNGCLPGRLLQQEFHVHYISTSPHATSAEQFATFRDHVKSTETEPQSEEASHMGGNANHPCRKCHWGGSQKEKETEELYHQCHLAGVARNVAEIRENLERQLQMAMHGDKTGIENLQRATGTKDKVAQHWIDILLKRADDLHRMSPRQSKADIASEIQTWFDQQPGEKLNPLLDITGLDPSQDTPVELLHTILLGVMKYIWHFLNTSQWSDTDRHLLAIRLQSTDISGLTVPPIRAGYMIQYRNNLIGKHFKTLMQVLIFHIHKICTPEQFTLVKAASDLGARLWVPEIDDMDHYLEQLKIAVANLLDAFDTVDPLRILVKIKLHLLAHLPDDIRRFGPAIRFATEIYEAYNGVFRLCSIYSNRLAPSRDISLKFVSMSRVKHLLSRGYWTDLTSKKWIQAGEAVQKILCTDPVFQRHLGWRHEKKPEVRWADTTASKHWAEADVPVPDSEWKKGCLLIMQNGDRGCISAWVFGRDSGGKTIVGCIHELLVGPRSLVTIERFVVGSDSHFDFGWPILRRPRGDEITEGISSFIVLDATAIQHLCSVEHDCRKGNCQPLLKTREVQEREATEREVSLIKHTDDDHFVLNLAAFHNFTQICRALPRRFTELKLLVPDRITFHKQQQSGVKSQKPKDGEAAEAEEAARQAELALERGDEIDGEEEPSDNDQEEVEEVEVPEDVVEEADDNERGRCGRKRRRRG